MQSVIIPVIDLGSTTTPRELNKCGIVNKWMPVFISIIGEWIDSGYKWMHKFN